MNKVCNFHHIVFAISTVILRIFLFRSQYAANPPPVTNHELKMSHRMLSVPIASLLTLPHPQIYYDKNNIIFSIIEIKCTKLKNLLSRINFDEKYPLAPLRSSSSCIRILSRLPVTRLWAEILSSIPGSGKGFFPRTTSTPSLGPAQSPIQ